MLKLLVIGLGQLGNDLVRVLKTSHEVVGAGTSEVDVRDSDSVARLIDTQAPDLVINAAAYTDVEGAEGDRKCAFAVNETGARNVAAASAARSIPVVYYSTDFVFDGGKTTPYQPADTTGPLSVYGASKLAGELATVAANPAHYIIRTAWLYGPGGNNFVEKVIGWAQRNDSIRVVTDEIGSPTQTWDLAEVTGALIDGGEYGVYHAVNRGVCSRFELAEAIVSELGLSVTLNECLSSEFVTKAERPAYSVLDCSSLDRASGVQMREWKTALHHYLARRKDLLQKGNL